MTPPPVRTCLDLKWPAGPFLSGVTTAIVLFVLLLALLLFKAFVKRLSSLLPIAIACVMEIIGYVNRYLSYHEDPYNKQYFIIQYFFIVVAPVLIAAVIYVGLTNLILWATKKGQATPLKPRMVLWFFITVDVVTTVIQVTGAALIGSKTSKHEDPTSANHILLAGLAVQTLSFAIYLLLFACFITTSHACGIPLRSQRGFITALALASVLVIVRTLFRLVETAQGLFGYLRTQEAFFGILEFAPIVLAVSVLAVWSPHFGDNQARKTRRDTVTSVQDRCFS